MRGLISVGLAGVIAAVLIVGCKGGGAEAKAGASSAKAATGAAPREAPTAQATARDPYALSAADVRAKVGAGGTLAVVVDVVEGYKWNDEFPVRLAVTPPPTAHVRFPKAALARGDAGVAAEKQRATLSLPFEALTAGAERVACRIDFSVCTSTKCLIFRDKEVVVTLTVE